MQIEKCAKPRQRGVVKRQFSRQVYSETHAYLTSPLRPVHLPTERWDQPLPADNGVEGSVPLPEERSISVLTTIQEQIIQQLRQAPTPEARVAIVESALEHGLPLHELETLLDMIDDLCRADAEVSPTASASDTLPKTA